MSWNTGLTGSALSIAKTNERRLRVVAGPGTGKSFALKRRVARLLEEGQDPTRILAVTFTRNAADSLVQDLTKLDVAGCEKVRVGTLHAYCFSLLNREDVFAYLKRAPRPIITFSKSASLQFEGGMMIDDLVEEGGFGGKRDCTKRVRAFEAAWARLQSEEPGWAMDATDQRFEKCLVAWLCFHRAMLIGELVPEALRFLRNNPMSDALKAFDHVIVDEYQDLNRAEQDIIDLLAKAGTAVVVGDADQSIYSFRHANPEGLKDFRTRHPTTHDELLAECRRCPTRVVRIADELIKHNYPSPSSPRLRAMSTNHEGEIHVIQWNDPEEEAQGVAEYISHLLTNQGYAPGDILVITPRRRLAYPIRDVIKGKGVPVHSFYQEEALEEEPAQRAFALLTLLAAKEDRVALRWWLGQGSQTGRSASYRRLRQHCEASGDSPWNVLEAIDRGDLQLPRISNLLKRFRDLKGTFVSLPSLALQDLVDYLLPEDDDSCTALREFAVVALPQSNKVSDLFAHIRTGITQPEAPEGDFVRIMSPQKSKGLTSKVVIVTGCIQGLLPIEKPGTIPEQRRLFYVAITRCTDILVFSSFVRIERQLAMSTGIQLQNHKGYLGRTIASRFISELGPTVPNSRRGSEWRASGYSDAVVNP